MFRINPVRWGSMLVLLLAISQQTVQAQLMSVTVTSVDGMMDTAKYGLTMAGKKDLADQLDSLLEAFTQAKGLKGIDRKKPMGAYLKKFPTNPTTPPLVLYVPITDEKDFLDLLDTFNITPSKPENGIRSVEIPFTGQRAYLLFKGNYAYVSLDEEELKNPVDPAKIFARFPANALFHMHLGLGDIPKEMKEKFLAEVDKNIAKDKAKKPEESDAEYQFRLAGMNYTRSALEHLVMEAQGLSFSVLLDKGQHLLSVDTLLTATPGSRLQLEMQALNNSKSQFAGVIDAAPASLIYHGALSDQVRKDLDTFLDKVVKAAIADEKSIMKKAIAEKIFQVIEPTLKSKTYDVAFSVRSGGDKEPLTGLGALRVVNGKQLEELVKGLIVEMKEKERKAIQIDADKIGDVNIHLINIPTDDKGAKEMVEAFGEAKIAIAFHNEAIVVGLGKNSVDEVKRVVSSINKTGGMNPPPMQVLVHVKPFTRFSKEAAVRKAFETIFTTPGSDAIKFTMTGGDQLRWKAEVSTQFLKLIEASEKAKGE
ncbi:MAG TPA: hypothetical protein PLN21_15670 [Gemmatales bacterium]|nr:hypothetical protein [Gemmatales bacterium]